MMPAAFGPVLPATSWITVMLVCAEENPPISHEKCPKVHVTDRIQKTDIHLRMAS